MSIVWLATNADAVSMRPLRRAVVTVTLAFGSTINFPRPGLEPCAPVYRYCVVRSVPDLSRSEPARQDETAMPIWYMDPTIFIATP